MDIVTGRDTEVANWLSGQISQPIVPPYVCVGFIKNGQLAGAALFNDFNFSNIELTIYGPGCMTRQAIRFVFLYAFDLLKVNRVSARTRRSNAVMRKLLPRLGFTYEGTARRYYGPERADDALLFTLFPDSARKWMTK